MTSSEDYGLGSGIQDFPAMPSDLEYFQKRTFEVINNTFLYVHRRRLETEAKAKVIASVWGTEFMQFLAALAIVHKDFLKNRMNCTRMV